MIFCSLKIRMIVNNEIEKGEVFPGEEVQKALRVALSRTAEVFYGVSKVIIDKYGDEGREVIKEGVKLAASLYDRPKKREFPSPELRRPLWPWTMEVKSTPKLRCVKTLYCPLYETFKKIGGDALEIGRLYCENYDSVAYASSYENVDFKRLELLLDTQKYCLSEARIKD